VTVEVLFLRGCPHAAAARAMVERCVARLGLAVEVAAREGDYPSPTVMVDGVDVMGAPAGADPVCRLDLPTEERVMSALAEALR
jgi:hypothetical protein